MNSRISGAILASLLLLSACGYEGDGEYSADGIWPFRYYELKIPEFPFQRNTEKTFDLIGYESHGKSLLTVTFIAQRPVEFHELHLPVSVTLSANDDKVFVREGSLNQHFLRMRSEGATSWPTDDEWNCDFVYADSRINSQAVRFDNEQNPSPTTELSCFHFVTTEQNEYRLRVAIPDSAIDIGDAVVKIKLTSSWK